MRGICIINQSINQPTNQSVNQTIKQTSLNYLDGDVGEVYERVVDIVQIIGIFGIAEPSKPMHVLIHLERAIGGDQDIYPQIEFLAAHQQRVFNVSEMVRQC